MHRSRCLRLALGLTTTALVAGLAMAPSAGAQAGPSENADADASAAAAVAQMTLAEKIALINSEMPVMLAPAQRPGWLAMGAGYVAGNARLGIPPQVMTDASLGVANLMDMRKGDVATAMPSGLAQAATWNPALVREGGRMIGSEARAKGFNVMLAGGVNLVRDPRAGRNFEYLGEDPLLAGRLVGAQIAGVQDNHIVSTIKHFALNDQETGRSSASVELDEGAMRESDLLAFQIGIETGKPGAVMCAYNLVRGKFSCEDAFLLTQVLRKDWGFDGYVMSDWGSVHSTESLLAGLDQQSAQRLDRKRWFSTELEAALADGRVKLADVDRAVTRIVRTLFAHGLDRHPVGQSPIDYAANGQVARRVAEEGIVLLKNRDNLLPLAATARRVVVIGGHADVGVLSGGGSSQVVPVGGFRKVAVVKEGASAAFGRRGYGGTPPLEALRAALPGATVQWVDGTDLAAAAAAARAADVAIVFGEQFATEASDRPDLSLDGNGDALISAVAAANPRTIAVLQNGKPVAMPWRDAVGAILVAWFPGQHGGDALANIVTGRANPSGRLPFTFPASLAQLPNPVLPGSDLPPPDAAVRATYGINANSRPFDIRYPEGSDAGYRWFDRTGARPLYAFGYGLSYTRFRFDRLKVQGGDGLTVSFRVTNTGRRAGADVPQVYVGLPGHAKRLAGWDKIVLQPGEARTVTVTAEPRILADYDTTAGNWARASGPARVEVARAADDPVLVGTTRFNAGRIKP